MQPKEEREAYIESMIHEYAAALDIPVETARARAKLHMEHLQKQQHNTNMQQELQKFFTTGKGQHMTRAERRAVIRKNLKK